MVLAFREDSHKQRNVTLPLIFYWRLHGYTKQHNVDFIGGDINMGVFSTVGDVFSDPEFSAPCKSFLWGLGPLEEPNRECGGLLIMPKRPYECRLDTHAATTTTTLHLALGHVTKPLTFLCFSTFAPPTLPGPDSIMRSQHAQQRRLERT